MNVIPDGYVCSYKMPAFGKPWFIMSDLRWVGFVIYCYIMSIWALEKFFQSRKPLHVQRVLVAHNLFSTSYSAVLFVGIGRSMWRAHIGGALTFQTMTCDESYVLYPYISFWIHMFYLSKYYELVDTFLLVIRKKNVSFLHFFHHSSYLLVCFGLSTSGYTFQFVAVFLNSFVHFLMYMYYFLSSTSLKQKVGWIAKQITTIQLLQFVTGNAYQSVRFGQTHIMGKQCSGSMWWAWTNAGVTIGFMMLFAQLYQSRYQRARRTADKPSTRGKTD